jgi:hypothetical protein
MVSSHSDWENTKYFIKSALYLLRPYPSTIMDVTDLEERRADPLLRTFQTLEAGGLLN